MPAINVSGKELRRVVIAASVGNIIEWYDFYIFGSLASILAAKFFEKSHPVAAFILFALRLIQGLCLGGEYGGAITYVAEHIEDKHRGYYTGWLQTSPTLGIVVSLAVIIGTRTYQ